MWQENSTENLDTPPLLSIKFSLPEIFSNTVQTGSLTKLFGTVTKQTFDGKSLYPPFIHKIRRHPKSMKHYRILLRLLSALWDKKFSTEIVYTAPSLFHIFFRYRKVSRTQQRRVPLRKVSVLWDKTVSRQTRESRLSVWSLTFFDNQKFRKIKGISCKTFRHCETK